MGIIIITFFVYTVFLIFCTLCLQFCSVLCVDAFSYVLVLKLLIHICNIWFFLYQLLLCQICCDWLFRVLNLSCPNLVSTYYLLLVCYSFWSAFVRTSSFFYIFYPFYSLYLLFLIYCGPFPYISIRPFVGIHLWCAEMFLCTCNIVCTYLLQFCSFSLCIKCSVCVYHLV